MENLPILTIDTTAYIQSNAVDGYLINNYIPFKNLVNTRKEIVNFRTLNFKDSLGNTTVNINTPINIEIQPSFDGSVNLILNNDSENPKLINSRFSVEEGNKFSIPDHGGNRDSNLYEDLQLNLDTRLYKSVNKIPILDFNGLGENGKMKCGSYHFYFKFADNDGNETDFISESGLVVCHIGNHKDPGSVRMGMVDEVSGKSVNFTLSNIDSSYDFIKVYYTRTTSDNSQQDILTTHYIDNKFPINGDKVNISITGVEVHVDISVNEINILYELADTIKAQAQCQNMLFFGNINKVTIPYEDLKKYSLDFIPKVIQHESIGNLNNEYKDASGKESYEYYNPENLYYNLGVWPEEYYRFGIVYILNDYTLSPVFNTRGIDFTPTTEYTGVLHTPTPTISNPQINEDGFIEQGKLVFENAKGIIKMPKVINVGTVETPQLNSVITSAGVKPWGIEFTNSNTTELKKITKGYFIVRQERIPTIYAQGLSIAKTKNEYGNIPVVNRASLSEEIGAGYFTQGFLDSSRKLQSTYLSVSPSRLDTKAAIVPEAEIRSALFNQLFTSSDYKLSTVTASVTGISLKQSATNFYLEKPYREDNNVDYELVTTKLTMVNDGMSLTTNGEDYFAAKAGDAEQAWNTINIASQWTTAGSDGINSILTASTNLVRGEFGTYIGMNKNRPFGSIFNIRSSDFSEEHYYKKNMFTLRMDSSEPYMAISDRITWNTNTSQITTVFRGDCFVGNFTHRMNRNFIDPDLPTNHKIIDKNTWNKNYAVYQDASSSSGATNRVLTIYKSKNGSVAGADILEPSDAKYANAGTGLANIFSSAEYKEYGCSKINRGDVNAVPLGHWVTFKVMSNINLSMRDIDFNNPAEESVHGKKRGFYPLQAMNSNDNLPESNIINGGANVTLSKRPNFIIPDVPFIKNKFDTRILYSDIHTTDAFKNGYRVFSAGHYRDYTKIYGSIVDMKEWYGNLFVTMEHGCILIPVNERAIAGEGQGGNVYINTSNVLPENPKVMSDLFGSTWAESVIKTKTGIYGIDTVSKKLWKFSGENLSCISDLKVQKFLNDNIDLRESDKLPTIGLRNVKSHYNKNKGDIMFTFYSETKEWNLCYNENLEKFITLYSWIPSHSANINNVFFSFDKAITNQIYNESLEYVYDTSAKLWKHGQSGIYNNQGKIKPTTWYRTTSPFEFEFVVTEIPIAEKIFNNLKLISNKVEPKSFEFEIVGEVYDFYEVKDLISWINNQVILNDNVETVWKDLNSAYTYILSKDMSEILGLYPEFIKPFKMSEIDKFQKLPFIKRSRIGNLDTNSTEVKLVEDNLLQEDRIHTQQGGNSIKKYGRLKGNMMYLEDFWNVEIRPITFKYAYLSNNILKFTDGKEVRLRDKYIKIRVKYSGTELAIIQGIKTAFNISYA